jgi:putative Mn2+ efflux pump MntP
MSSLVGLLLVSVSVGLSNFAGSIGIGLSGIDGWTRLRVGVAFGLFEALMPLVGLLVGHAVAGYLGHIAKYIGSAILVLTGIYTIWQGRHVPDEQQGPARLETNRLLVTAFALSIDNLAVGFALGAYRINIVIAAVTMGVISVALSLVGLELGSRLGARVEQWSDELGGAVLILVGIAIALGLLG